ncbi:class I SAM-dependent methyltransferase [Fructobacillus fructosus]|uniref:class I SAM-dependent methyltransferase n=1 Tax=Fructobacillus fructosus TaxID=1631 RepID=UPI002DAF543D|nr:Ubiquinone/menaquinone biosynthesis C-methylase UbiE/MenG (UbiE) [Fructobacillus fructosus]CAK1248518.1 Ubiquinone/menaquinone biosynthesis C-methylase UbiE/MenG (UbiE) [Fructobacillus fructosus]CAK1249300.1 Ubiquinone/menaquinone biosynthesis C-methylase UbiE/MenG (UbiE) [Fructobacillus fructosus]
MKKLNTKDLDAPLVPFLYILIGIIAIASAFTFHQQYNGYIWILIYGLLMIGMGAIFINTSINGKQKIWNHIIAKQKINPNSEVLDLGTGHGLVLLKFANHLSDDGHATGIDLWRNSDQSNNNIQNTQQIIKQNHLEHIVNIETANMIKLPFESNKYDYVVSGLAFHNIKPASARTNALKEATRVLSDNGTLIIVDTGHHKKEYLKELTNLGMAIIETKTYGISGWWTGPWMPTYSIIAKKNHV